MAFNMKGPTIYKGAIKKYGAMRTPPESKEGKMKKAPAPKFLKGMFKKSKGKIGAKDILTGGMSRIFSDIRLKENIVKLGNSAAGIPIYEFNYIGQDNVCQGTMAQDLLSMGYSDAVSTDESGYYMVDYNMIDVDPVI